MKIIVTSIITVLSVLAGYAQTNTSKAAYRRFPTVPPFTLLKVDSTTFTRDNLPKNKKMLIMYFSPGCDHCRHQMDTMLANIDKLKNIEILLATYQPFEEMKKFYQEYKLANYPNILIGRDSHYFFPPFYKITNLPFQILYDEKSKLITTFEGSTQFEKVLKAFKVHGS